MSEEAGGGMSQAQLARKALEEAKKKAEETPEEKTTSELTARQRAMQGLAKGGVVSKREAQGIKGETQHSEAMKKLGVPAHEPNKVIPNWKMTGAQKAAHEAKMEMRGKGGESQMSAAMKAFGSKIGEGSAATATTAPNSARSFVPTQKTPGGSSFRPGGGGGMSTAPSFRPGGFVGGATTSSVPKTPPPPPSNIIKAEGTAGAAEAEQGVEHDLELLIAGIKRLGSVESDGSCVATFGKVVDDEELEQQLESLVGTLKAGRRRGVLEWPGQLLLKGKDDAVQIKLVGPKQEEAPAPPPPEPPKEEPVAEEEAAPAAEVEIS